MVKWHNIAIYGKWIAIVVCDDILKERNSKRWMKLFRRYDYDGPIYGLHCYTLNVHAIFLNRREITHGAIAHEIFHMTHRIMEFIDHPIAPNCHEPHAYLIQYITDLVYKDLNKWKVKIKDSNV